MKSYRKFIFVAAALVLPAVTVAVYWRFKSHTSPHPLKTSFYIWQESWAAPEETPLAESIALAAPRADSFMFFAAEIRTGEGRATVRRKRPDWPTLARAGRPVVPVVRMGVAFSKLIASDRAACVDLLKKLDAELESDVRAAGAAFGGIQFDYDCPTARLGDYARLMADLRQAAPEMRLSITALPTWLASGEFKNLTAPLDYFVLQVHGLERPKTISDPLFICDAGRIGPWASQAARAGKPFWLALPTYSYEAYFDAAGKFLGIAAEGMDREPRAGTRMIRVESDPTALAGVVSHLKARSPRELAGIVWFRLPSATDRLNWPWPMLDAVMEGSAPKPAFAAEVRNPKPGLYEVWLANTGQTGGGEKVALDVDWRGQNLIASDMLGAFRAGSNPARLTGPAPRPGPPQLIAWYRIQSNANELSNPITVGTVESVR